jgi:hypothetical protein
MNVEKPVPTLYGCYHDRLLDRESRLICDYGWSNNVIRTDCRRLLAGFMLGTSDTFGIQALQVGAGLDTWDDIPPPDPTPGDTLTDASPFSIPRADLDITFLELTSDANSLLPTNRVQIQASLGPGVPSWPDATHVSSTLREFGLVAQLNGNAVLINLVRHRAIAKDPTSTLERTIWLVF